MEDSTLALIKDCQKRWKSEEDARADALLRRRAYEGSWSHLIPKQKGEPSWHGNEARSAPNILQLAIKQLSTLYAEEPARVLRDDSSSARTIADDMLWSYGMGLSAAMRRADSLCRLLGTAMLVPLHKRHPDAAADTAAALMGMSTSSHLPDEPGIEAVVIGREDLVAVPNPLDPRLASAVAYRVGSMKIGGKSVDLHHYWDDLVFARLVDWKPQTDGEALAVVEHGMGAHPCVLIRNDEGDLRTYGIPLGGDDLIPTMIAIGTLLREYNRTALLQRGQPVIRGELEKGSTLAPDSFLQIAPNAEFMIVRGGADLTGMREALMTNLELFARALDLPSRTLQLEASGMSGVAIALDRAVLDDDRKQRAQSGEVWERRFHRAAGRVLEAMGDGALPELEAVLYRPLPQFVTQSDRQTRLAFQRAQGLISRRDALAEIYPELTAEQLDDRLDRADTEQAELRAQAQEEADAQAQREAAIAAAGAPAPVEAAAAPDPLASLFS